MLAIARRLLGGLAVPGTETRPVHEPAVAMDAAAKRALERVRRGQGPAPFTGDERVLLHAAALPVLLAAQEDPTPGVSPERVDELVDAIRGVATARFCERVHARLLKYAARGGAQARDLAAAATLDPLKLAVRAATCTPRALTGDDLEREMLEEFFTIAHPPPELLEALIGLYLDRGDQHAVENVRAARELLLGRRPHAGDGPSLV